MNRETFSKCQFFPCLKLAVAVRSIFVKSDSYFSQRITGLSFGSLGVCTVTVPAFQRKQGNASYSSTA